MNIYHDHLHARHDRVIKHRHGGAERADLHVLLMVSNPIRFRSRWKLAEDTFKRVKEAGGILCVAEVTHGHRDFVLGDGPTPIDIYLQLEVTGHPIWIKEAAQNKLLSKVASEHIWAQYFLFQDADIAFKRDDIFNEIVQLLQIHPVLQPWSVAQDLGPDYTPIMEHHSFVYSWMNNEAEPPHGYYYGAEGSKIVTWHPGYAWAYTRQALNDLGCLLTVGALGSSDNHMAKGLVGNAEASVHPDMDGAYRREVLEWQHRADTYIKQNIGLVPGTIDHFWHGAKAKRRYWDRWKILTEYKFNPDTDIKLDWQGLPTLVVEDKRQRKMARLILEYLQQRDEDATSA